MDIDIMKGGFMPKKKNPLDEMFDFFGINDITDLVLGKKDKAEAIKRITELSKQKKECRLVINLPEWLKTQLNKHAKEANTSMNEVIRSAIIEYLANKRG
jgi:hypothetical protein